MNPLAKELNDLLDQKAHSVFRSLSSLGQKLFFPKGILVQSAEAKEKAHKFNATLGIATDHGQPIYLESIHNHIQGIEPKDVYPYAPGAGKPELRKLWREKIKSDNAGLNGKEISLPIVTSGITHGLSLLADLFIDPSDQIILPDKYWGNYKLLFENRYQGKIVNYSLFNKSGGFNLESFEEVLNNVGKDQNKLIVLLNFPNNPTGYTPTVKEGHAIVDIVKKQADKGKDIVLCTDDSYFGLFYEEGSMKESIFAEFVGCHPNIFCVKLDGVTKEKYAWGFRVGFMTFGLGDNTDSAEIFTALEKKVSGAIRSNLSNCCHLTQTLTIKNLESGELYREKADKYEIMQKRAVKVKEVLNNPKYDTIWNFYPFNSGYFMCLELKDIDAEEYRQYLLNNYGIGVISSGASDIRIAFSCVQVEDIEELFETMAKAAHELKSV